MNHIIENESYWSQAQYNHHAFTYLSSKKILAIPVSGYQNNIFKSKILLYKLSSNFSVQKLGRSNLRYEK